ncbi:MAG: LLM class F420-dependent oxidoreductase [Chloroflexi bacterium RBG_19FT_COMBO_62_14]|nr:MAG: LLM class F420-dependent oxidoreductase [Chloroflexi bacterium RBG_19FT_COMBO_62_14]
MRIGLQVPRFTWAGGAPRIREALAEIARAADEAGFYSLWVMDHFFQIRGVGEIDEPMLEGYTTLAYMAGLTEKVKLGTLVSGVVYRKPGLVVKEATTLDVLSGGRAYLGIGAAWNEREALGLGFDFPPRKVRFEWLEETLRIAHLLWSGQVGVFHGKHFRLEETLNSPQPISKPHPPIMVGGGGERKTLRLAAQYGDACNLFSGQGLETLKHKLDVLKHHCEELGRAYNEIEKTTLGTIHLAPGAMSATGVVALCRDLAGVGIQHAIFNLPNVHEIVPLRTFAREIIPEVAAF